MNQPAEVQTITTGNKDKESNVETKKNNNEFSIKLNNAGIVADLTIDVRLKIGDNADVITGASCGNIGLGSSDSVENRQENRTPQKVPNTPK